MYWRAFNFIIKWICYKCDALEFISIINRKNLKFVSTFSYFLNSSYLEITSCICPLK